MKNHETINCHRTRKIEVLAEASTLKITHVKLFLRLRQEDSKKGVKLMTADSNYEIRLLGAKVILNMAQQNTTPTKDRLSSPARKVVLVLPIPIGYS